MSETKVQIYFIVVFVLALRAQSHSYCTSTYGQEVCSFLPAPPGKTPPCALPGLTYCEHPEHYPGQRIQYLIQKWRLDHSTILIDESRDDFSSYYYPPPKYGPPNTLKSEHFYPDPIYIPKPNYVFDHGIGNTYIPPHPPQFQQNQTTHIGPYPQGRLENYKYSNDIPPSTSQVYGVPSVYPGLTVPQFTPFIKVWNRKDEKYGKTLIRKKRSEKIAANLRKLKSMHYNNGTLHRNKRQNALTGQTLCESRSQFIMPRAALNSKGNWMFVVNMPELDNRFTQLVKSETCASQTCSGLCGLPAGYTSRCEQKYVQKRLVALQGAGNELYNDIFWIPSCCVCTISNG